MKVQRYDLSAIKCNQALPSSNWIKGEDHDFIVSDRDKLIDEMISALDGFVMENWCRKCYYLQDDNYKDCIRISCSVLQQRCLLDRAEAMRGGKG